MEKRFIALWEARKECLQILIMNQKLFDGQEISDTLYLEFGGGFLLENMKLLCSLRRILNLILCRLNSINLFVFSFKIKSSFIETCSQLPDLSLQMEKFSSCIWLKVLQKLSFLKLFGTINLEGTFLKRRSKE